MCFRVCRRKKIKGGDPNKKGKQEPELGGEKVNLHFAAMPVCLSVRLLVRVVEIKACMHDSVGLVIDMGLFFKMPAQLTCKVLYKGSISSLATASWSPILGGKWE